MTVGPLLPTTPRHRVYVDSNPCYYERSIFPDGAVHVRLLGAPSTPARSKEASITATLRSSDDIMELLLLTDAVRRQHRPKSFSAIIPYFPYAQQDRVCSPGESLAVKIMADLINAQKYDEVCIWDPHSDVTGALVNCSTLIPQHELAESIFSNLLKNRIDTSRTLVVSPDAGSLKKLQMVAARWKMGLVRADKTRDPATNKITGTVVYSGPVGDMDFMMMDDICIGGKTFTELAEKLRPLTKGKIYLCVTHGIFNAGFDVFKGLIDHIFVYNSFVPATELPDFVSIPSSLTPF